ncbi:orotidine-5'-phosphate decarboxylase [Cellvibrio japonicus]|uniref:Orotidine 5'-phosphate decarboxylase n=1 Tax=Cellvibrio japonicus (strain Ueda107) TaxID=498211 RepID=PYRF_CELJU|nr:orotidine-5'-phosphate decarboxylase [Cellvibrio japonicus]B3PDW7.1 RecName: Full=Orotidine 5'-phosphate decarboxylase; AltName: Full=OMP decarboxylase; Short=OMPDCase; Short=OMPdecase [Cellvibrio japonicus Ueda107]ACE83335.1 orotidine 5'-phosphate decarboxylase [Cellvibrio japonicus Ueda107]QEI13451.1 orotidine-5'-phosphate decarboxylase [Cellvibrio japonicus]QEI17025.1 orotidine-5'-phosphate decarboxylase [Cellvibrio japonicus]QEI20603.1 orotidine-5'-phosphate decarboxylase [Cellvibrio ja
MSFIEKLKNAWVSNNSLLCIGLDPDTEKFPDLFKTMAKPEAVFAFNKAIIDATHDLVCAYKPQIAYFSAEAAETSLEQTIAYIKTQYPHIPVILDAKRGDIGSTAQKYAAEAFERYQADAVTVNPYLGLDSITPFTAYRERGTILLCRTSNSGAADLQDLSVDGIPLYQKVAITARDHWNSHNNCLLVVGATWPEQMAAIRQLVGDMPFLVPGVGAQGGDVNAMVKAGKTADGNGLIISSSRAVLYASNGDDFAQAARAVALSLRQQINVARA